MLSAPILEFCCLNGICSLPRRRIGKLYAHSGRSVRTCCTPSNEPTDGVDPGINPGINGNGDDAPRRRGWNHLPCYCIWPSVPALFGAPLLPLLVGFWKCGTPSMGGGCEYNDGGRAAYGMSKP